MIVLFSPRDCLLLCFEGREHVVRVVFHNVIVYRASLWAALGTSLHVNIRHVGSAWSSTQPNKQAALLSYLQYDGFLPGNFDCLPGRVSEDGPRKRADIGDCAAKRIGLILANDPEGLPPAVSPEMSEGHAERGATFVGRRRDHFRTCAPRTPVTDFPLRDRGSLCVALIDCGPVGRLEAAERHRDRREAFFRHQVAMRG